VKRGRHRIEFHLEFVQSPCSCAQLDLKFEEKLNIRLYSDGGKIAVQLFMETYSVLYRFASGCLLF